jgi:VRR-NUC domain
MAAIAPRAAGSRRLTAADVANRRTTERDFTAQVIELAHLLGWRVAHFRPAMTARGWRTPVQGDGQGFPDLILVRRDRLIAAELKREKGGVVSEDQRWWLAAFDAAGLETAVWRPSDFDRIAEDLR